MAMDTSSLFRVDGMVAVISGAGSGIGLMMAKALASAGAHKVYILGRRASSLESAAAQSPAIIPIVCDVTSKASLQRAVDRVASETGGYVNLVAANSGAPGPMATYDPPLGTRTVAELRRDLFGEVGDADTDDDNNNRDKDKDKDRDMVGQCDDLLRVNVTGAYLTMVAFLGLLDAGNRRAVEVEGAFGAPLQQQQGSSRGVPSIQSQVVFTGSVGAYSRQLATRPFYGGSKAAVTQMAQQAATGLASHGIRVNTLAPGWFHSEMSSGVMATRDPETEGPDHDDFMPARRWGTEEEMAGSILYLASRAGAYCNGLVLLCDGGRAAVVPSTY